MSNLTRFRLDKAAFMTEINEKTPLKAVNGRVVSWYSDDPAIAAVDENGLVTAISDGDTVIKAESENGEIAECRVSVGYHGQNPLLPPAWGLFIADGEPHVFNDRMYIYGSRDNAFGKDETGRLEFCSSDYHVIYSDDLLHWTDAGVSISVEDFPDELRFCEPVEAEKEQEKDKAAVEEIRYLWAPDLFKAPQDERYYLTFCSPHEYFIAESTNPCGPFENVRRITYQGKRIKGIDPGVLVDDDGRVYIALPSPFRLGELDPDKGYAEIIDDSIVSVEELVSSSPDGCYGFEGPSLRKFNGLYYYIYIASRHGDRLPVRMNYLVSENIRSGWRFGGNIIDTNDYLNGCNVHGSIESFGGKLYLSYHRLAAGVSEELKPGFHSFCSREMCMEEISLREDGSICPAVMTSSGVKGAFVCGEKIPAAAAVYFSGGRADLRFTHRGVEKPQGSKKWHFEGYSFAWFEHKGQFIGYRYIDLTDCKSITVSVRTSAPGAILLLRDSLTGETMACMSLPDTDGQWKKVIAPLMVDRTGKYDLTIELAEVPQAGKVELDWFQFA